MLRILIIALFACILSATAPAQDYRTNVQLIDIEKIKGLDTGPFSVPDSIQVYRTLKDILTRLREKGYLAASVDSLVFDSLEVEAWLYAGPRFEWGRLSMDSVDKKVLRKARVRPSAFSGKPLRYPRLANAQGKILTWYENNGYPFSALYINNIEFPDQGSGVMAISGELNIEKNGLFMIDTIHIRGEAKIDRNYLERLFGLESGDVYRQDRISGIGDRIRETPFLEEIKPAELEFFEEEVDVYTYLKKSRANQFNGIIGVFPDHDQTGKLFVTGDLHLYLVNSFGKGESFRFAWKALQPLSQELDVSIEWPYVFNSPVGVAADFNLFKQDTSWLTVNPVLDLRFFLGGNNYLNAFYEVFSSSLISTSGMENINRLPAHADLTSHLYGLGFQYRDLDYLYNPRRGWDLQGRLGIGTRTIRKNPGLQEELYDSINLSSTKIRGWATIGFFQPLGNRFSIHLKSQTAYLHTENLFENELFRLGGIHTLRGVDENSIFASFYSLGTVEARYIFEQNSNFFLFADGGYYEKSIPGDFESDRPFGFGGGVNLSTRAGIFSLVYAIGKQFGNPINIGKAKIHFGYLNRF